MPRDTIKLPNFLAGKIRKTGYTRGAENDEIYQNRVSRAGTVLIRYELWVIYYYDLVIEDPSLFEKGYIVLVSPAEYLEFDDPAAELDDVGLKLGYNAVIFYELREDWERLNPDKIGWRVAVNRKAPVGGEYIARIHGTTATDDRANPIFRGFTTKEEGKGAGIRVYEYASGQTIADCKAQLSALYWLCENSTQVAVEYGMSQDDANRARDMTLRVAERRGMLDKKRLQDLRMIDLAGYTICPLCLQRLDAHGFYSHQSQMEGRETHDLTVTEINLFHIQELRPGVFNHRVYNLGWGHHFCNVVVADNGLDNTLSWMYETLVTNKSAGYFVEPGEQLTLDIDAID